MWGAVDLTPPQIVHPRRINNTPSCPQSSRQSASPGGSIMSAQLALPQRYLRTKEAAVILGLSTRTLEKHRTHGTGPKYSKVGGRVLYAVNELTAWAECGAKRSTSDPETILRPKPIDPVRHVKQVPDDAIIVGGEVTSPVMMGIPETARFLGLSVQTLAKHRTYGTGPKYHKVGRHILYAESDLTEWTERGAKRSTSDPETVRPARPASPADPVKPIKLVSESPIVVELEVAEPARLADGANLIEPVPDSAVAVEVDPIGLAKPVDEVNVVESVPDSAVAEVEAVEATKLSTRQGIHGTKPKYRLPSSWMMPSATIAARGSNSVNCSRRRGAARTDQAGWPAQIASLPRQLAQPTGRGADPSIHAFLAMDILREWRRRPSSQARAGNGPAGAGSSPPGLHDTTVPCCRRH
jgi:predicted DNA-binding transcriptional regulator AlpA